MAAGVETPLPGLGGEEQPQFIEEFDVMDGDIPDDMAGEVGMGEGMPMDPQAQADQAKFMGALTEIMSKLSEPCQEQFAQSMQGQTAESMTEECQLEFSQAAGSIPNYAKMQNDFVRLRADKAMRKNGRQPDPNTPYYLGVTLVLLFAALVGYVVYVNRKLKEAGLLDRKPKALSKKKMEKQRAKQAAQKKVV